MFVNKKKQIKTSNFLYCTLLLLYSILIFLFFGKHTAFEWTTTADIPLILRLIDPNFLQNDFYTNSLVDSSRFIFSNIIYGFTKLGIDWLSALYLFKVTIIVIVKPLLFLVYYNIWLRWKPPNLLSKDNEIIKIILLLFCLFSDVFFGSFFDFFGTLFSNYGFHSYPFGWGPIQVVTYVAPMTLSLVFGLIYNVASFNQKNLQYFTPFFLLLSVIIHPIVGFFHYIISVIFLLPSSISTKNLFKLCLDFLIGIVPAILLFTYYKSNSSINASEYIDIYVYLRHPHHYLMSAAVNGTSIFFIFIFFIPLYYSSKIKDKKYFVLSLLIFISIFLGPFIQFLGTEVWKVKLIAEIGPSRYSSFASFLWIINIIIVGSAIYNTSIMKKDKWLKKLSSFFLLPFVQNIFMFFQIIFFKISFFLNVILFKIGLKVAFSLLLILLAGTFLFTQKHPLEYYDDEARSLIKWISKNSEKNSVFFVREGEFDSFLVRVYGKRAIFSDPAFPFNDNYIQEFKDRFLIYKKSHQFESSDYSCLQKHFAIDYLIVPSKVSFKNFSSIYSSAKWNIYDINEFNVNVNKLCNLKHLIGK